MNLRFTPTVLALVFAIKSAGARRTGEELLVSELADVHTDDSERNNEKSTAHRRAELISTSIFEQGPADGLRFYYPDVGILQGRKSHSRSGFYMNGRGQRSDADSRTGADKLPRFLEVKEAPICGTNNGTCLPSACDCIASGIPFSDRCAPVFNSLCNGFTDADGKNWTFEGCIPPTYYAGLREYLKHYSCPVVKCIVEGGTYGACFCQMYHSLCLAYGDERPYQPDERALGFCAADSCCQSKAGDEAGKMSCMFGRFSRIEYREEHPRCGANGTCSTSVCNCAANRNTMFDCFVPYNDICNEVPDANGKQWNFEGCFRDYPDYPDYQLYLRMSRCGIAKCVFNGGTYGSCYCQLFHSFCKAFGDERAYNYYAEAAGHCMIDNCCQTKVDEAGMLSCFGVSTSPATTEYPSIALEEPTSDQPTGSIDESSTSGANSLVSLADVKAKFSIAAAVVTVWSI